MRIQTAGKVYEAVVFDFDGTLVDSLPLVQRAFNHALAPFGVAPITLGLFTKLGAPPERAFAELLGDRREHVPAAIARLVDYTEQHGHLIQPYAGCCELVADLVQAGVAVAIWTGRDRSSAESIWAVHHLGPLLATTVCGDDLPTHKPHPEGMRTILSRLKVDAANTLYVGDADVDVSGGFQAGVDTLLITHGRDVDTAVAAQAWEQATTPEVAYKRVRSAVGLAP